MSANLKIWSFRPPPLVMLNHFWWTPTHPPQKWYVVLNQIKLYEEKNEKSNINRNRVIFKLKNINIIENCWCFILYYSFCCAVNKDKIRLNPLREAFKIKKRWNLEKSRNLLDLPLSNLGTLNCYFYIDYLDFSDHKMDFVSNLFFSLTKVVWYFIFSALSYIW